MNDDSHVKLPCILLLDLMVNFSTDIDVLDSVVTSKIVRVAVHVPAGNGCFSHDLGSYQPLQTYALLARLI